MKKFWNWKWRSVPMGIVSAVLIVVLMAGSVFAGYSVWSGSAKVTVEEAITSNIIWDINGAELYPGGPLSKGGWMQLGIENEGPAPLDITVELSLLKDGDPVFISSVLKSWAMLAEGAAVEDGEDFTIYTAVNEPAAQLALDEANPGSLAFEIGTVNYEPGDNIDTDSNAVWFWLSGTVRQDANPDGLYEFVIEVSRG